MTKNPSAPNSAVANHPLAAMTTPCFIRGPGASANPNRAAPTPAVNPPAIRNASAGSNSWKTNATATVTVISTASIDSGDPTSRPVVAIGAGTRREPSRPVYAKSWSS
ncbi:hypothetical protein BRD03_07795 [Halobacteriales archaeon QS_9_68_17]|nr:MAG: hypothetical protein BRD03_07795 [Halobacteriales archaeon QS_9_68_17]